MPPSTTYYTTWSSLAMRTRQKVGTLDVHWKLFIFWTAEPSLSLRYLLLNTAAVLSAYQIWHVRPASGVLSSGFFCVSILLFLVFNHIPHLSPISLQGQCTMLLILAHHWQHATLISDWYGISFGAASWLLALATIFLVHGHPKLPISTTNESCGASSSVV